MQMSNIKQVIQKIFISNDLNIVDHIKKLIYLTVNDVQNFSPYAIKVAKLTGQSLNSQETDDNTKLYFLKLLSEIATNYFQQIPSSYYNFAALINLLSDQNAQIRRASHCLLLIFIKKYEKIDEVIQSYHKTISQNPDHWKSIQKIIHSFQSLLVIQPKCITYGKNYQSMDQFLRLLLAFRAHHHHLIQKASDQTVSSFVKNEFVGDVLPKLNSKIMVELTSYAQKLNIKLSINKTNFGLYMNSQQSEQLQQIKIQQKQSHPNKKSKKRLLLQQFLKNIQSEDDWKAKVEAVQAISNQLANCDERDIPQDLMDKVLDITYDFNFKTCMTAMNIVLVLVTKFNKFFQHKKEQVEEKIIQKLCDLKMAVRQVACKILKKLYQSPNKSMNKKLLIKLSNCSIVGKQQILNFLQQNYSSVESNDLTYVLGDISSQLANDNTRIKLKTIDCLVKLCISNDLQQCKQILQKKLNKIYYDMFMERLKQKIGQQKSQKNWDNDKNFNKGMTWQAQRTTPTDSVDKQSLTKVQFGIRKLDKDNNNSNMIDTIDDFNYSKPMKKVQNANDKKTTLKSVSNKTANTFDTFQSQDSNSYKLTKKNHATKPSNSFLSQQQQWKPQIQQKKAPLKPNPIKKKATQTTLNPREQSLVIQSKQYLTKNEQQVGSKFSAKVVPKQPFSIKKTITSKQPKQTKQKMGQQKHQIDYKATYYAAKQELAPLDNPNSAIKQIITNLPKDNQWNKQFQAMNLVRRFIKNHQESYQLFYDNLGSIMPEILKLLDNLRSTLAKNAMITLSELCQALKKAMDPFLQPIFVRLFKKSQDANSFIVEEVRKCMTSLCEYCSTNKIASIILTNCQAKAMAVKLKIALCIDKLCQKKDYEIQTLKQNPKLVGMMNNLISDSTAQVRNLIRQTFENICRNNKKDVIQDTFKKNGTKQSWEKFKKILDKQTKTMGY